MADDSTTPAIPQAFPPTDRAPRPTLADPTISRRSLLRGAAGLAVAASLGAAGCSSESPSKGSQGPKPARKQPKRVAVLGAGVAGLTAAHELAERGFSVTVYERKALGGKARSIPVPETGVGGRRDLPGEHGFRFFPGLYQNVPDTMERIPFPGNANGVLDNLVAATEANLSRGAGRADLVLPSGAGVLGPTQAARTLSAMFQEIPDTPPEEVAFFVNRLLVFLGSSEARRFGEWEHTSWWDFARADDFSEAYRVQMVESLTRNLVAARADIASAMTIGVIGEGFIYNAAKQSGTGEIDRLLNGPTNEVWIEPWVAELRRMGVTFEAGVAVKGFALDGARVAEVRAEGPDGEHQIDADWFVCSVPPEKAATLMSDEVLEADPDLVGIARLTTEWMTGIQFYLDRSLPIVAGHVSYTETPWSLTSISQGQFWTEEIATTYGDGRVRDILSVDISNWGAPGILTGKTARASTKEEIALEVWEQLKSHLNGPEGDVLTDEMRLSFFLDPAITFLADPKDPDVIVDNDEPLLVNTINSWELRPRADTAIENLFLAGDYVQCNFNLATMEGANETGRLAANALLGAAGASSDPVKVFERYQPPEWDEVKRVDEERFKAGLPHLFDVPDVAGIPDLPNPEDVLGDLFGRGS